MSSLRNLKRSSVCIAAKLSFSEIHSRHHSSDSRGIDDSSLNVDIQIQNKQDRAVLIGPFSPTAAKVNIYLIEEYGVPDSVFLVNVVGTLRRLLQAILLYITP